MEPLFRPLKNNQTAWLLHAPGWKNNFQRTNLVSKTKSLLQSSWKWPQAIVYNKLKTELCIFYKILDLYCNKLWLKTNSSKESEEFNDILPSPAGCYLILRSLCVFGAFFIIISIKLVVRVEPDRSNVLLNTDKTPSSLGSKRGCTGSPWPD